jgi:formylglycine-generating enzyme required for sulfatase activity
VVARQYSRMAMRSMPLVVVLFVMLIVFVSAPGFAAPEKRVALVIGNGAYQYATPLSNPVNDARVMADALKKVGFELVDGKALLDLDRSGLEQAINRFGKVIRGTDVALFFYAGHGVQVDGKNYLIPILANVEMKTDIKYQLVDADFILDEMTSAGTKVNVIILDACRNNPFGGRGFRGTSTGLAQMSAPRGTIIAYSTAPGKVAADGRGNNSPFSSVLAETLIEPGLRIEDVFIQVGQEVEKSTGGEQEPWQANNLRGVFYFNAPTTVIVAPEIKAGPTRDNEALFWQSIMNDNNPAVFEEYLRKYPNGEFAVLARMKIDALQGKELLSSSPESPKPKQQAALPPPLSPPKEKIRAKEWRESATGMEFVWVAGGCYQMGCGAWANSCDNDERPIHEVCLDGFWMGKTEVTQAQWKKVMGNLHPNSWGGENCPVEWASWQEVQEFVRKLRQLNGNQFLFRLPTEAEWEYGCRSGGKPENYAGGSNADSLAWYVKNSGRQIKPVGTKTANSLGLFDMSGNTAEWTQDTYDPSAYSKHQRHNPLLTMDGPYRVVRGGGYVFSLRGVRCGNRFSNFDPITPYGMIGFRVVRSPDQ